LSTLVEQRLKLLKLAQRISTVPEGSTTGAANRFSHPVQTPEQATLRRDGRRHRCRRECRKAGPHGDRAQRVRSAVVRRTPEGEQAFTVAIMKPNAAMFDTTVGVERLSTEFSGGQRLRPPSCCTAHLLSACSRPRQERVADPGCSSSTTRSARRMLIISWTADRGGGSPCVQLLLHDGHLRPEVQAFFDTVVRLRNDADLRRHLNYIVLDEHIASVAAGGRALADTAGYVSPVASPRFHSIERSSRNQRRPGGSRPDSPRTNHHHPPRPLWEYSPHFPTSLASGKAPAAP